MFGVVRRALRVVCYIHRATAVLCSTITLKAAEDRSRCRRQCPPKVTYSALFFRTSLPVVTHAVSNSFSRSIIPDLPRTPRLRLMAEPCWRTCGRGGSSSGRDWNSLNKSTRTPSLVRCLPCSLLLMVAVANLGTCSDARDRRLF